MTAERTRDSIKFGTIVRLRHNDPVSRLTAGTEGKVIAADERNAFIKLNWTGDARCVTIPLGYLETLDSVPCTQSETATRVPTINPVSLRPGVDIVTVVSHTELLPFGTKCLWLGVNGGAMANVRALGKEWPISLFALAELDPVQANVSLNEFMVGYHALAETIGDREQFSMGTKSHGQKPTDYSRGAVKAAQDHESGVLGQRSRFGYHAYNEAMRDLAAEYPEEHVAIPAEVKL